MVYAEIDGADSEEGIVKAQEATLTLEHLTFGRSESLALAAERTALELSDCNFVGGSGFVRAVGGSAMIENCEFGEVTGDWALQLNEEPNGVATIRGNRFDGAGAKGALYLGRSALVLENLFSRSSSGKEAAIAVGGPVEVVVAGNGFLGWDSPVSATDVAMVQFEKNRCRFAGDQAAQALQGSKRFSDNVIPGGESPVVFAQPDSAWLTSGKRGDWKLLALAGEESDAVIDLLAVSGIPPMGKTAPGERPISFRYPGAASFRNLRTGVSQAAEDSTAVFTSDGSSPVDLEITLLSGKVLTVPNAAQWQTIPGHIDVMINEVVATGEDAIEFYNYGVTEVELSGFQLTDDREKPDKFVFPKGSVIHAGEYLVVELGRKNPAAEVLAADFGLSAEGEEILLLKPGQGGSEEPVDTVQFGPQVAGYSIGRIGDRWQLCSPTIGSANAATAVADARSVRLSEWLAAAGGGGADDFIELQNLASAPADISGCGLTDNIPTAPFRHRFPPLSFLPADNVQAFFSKGKKSKVGSLEFKLSDDGEVLGFLGPMA